MRNVSYGEVFDWPELIAAVPMLTLMDNIIFGLQSPHYLTSADGLGPQYGTHSEDISRDHGNSRRG